MNLDYATLHWGSEPTGEEDMRWPDAVETLAGPRIVAISYMTRKDEPAVYHHECGDGLTASERRELGKRVHPRLLAFGPLPGVTLRGRGRTCPAPGQLEALGRVIDVRLSDGTLLLPSLHWVCAAKEAGAGGSHVIIACRFGPVFAIEHTRLSGRHYPYITPHGIIG